MLKKKKSRQITLEKESGYYRSLRLKLQKKVRDLDAEIQQHRQGVTLGHLDMERDTLLRLIDKARTKEADTDAAILVLEQARYTP